MQQTKKEAKFTVDGYEITASFAESKNLEAIEYAKRILISSFINHEADKNFCDDKLAFTGRQSDNDKGINLCAP